MYEYIYVISTYVLDGMDIVMIRSLDSIYRFTDS